MTMKLTVALFVLLHFYHSCTIQRLILGNKSVAEKIFGEHQSWLGFRKDDDIPSSVVYEVYVQTWAQAYIWNCPNRLAYMMLYPDIKLNFGEKNGPEFFGEKYHMTRHDTFEILS